MNFDRWIEISNAQFEAFDAAQSLAHALDICGPDSPQVAARLAAWRAANTAWRTSVDVSGVSGQVSNHG